MSSVFCWEKKVIHARVCLELIGGFARLCAGTLSGMILCGLVYAATPLTDQPIRTTQAVPANVLLDLSVEYPTAISHANIDRTFSASKAYDGYFDPAKCYVYKTASLVTITKGAAEDISYFSPKGTAASGSVCSGAWSGNFLNWATMQAIDLFRKALTGGNREVDLPTSFGAKVAGTTILQRAYASNQGSTSNFPDKSLPSGSITSFTNKSDHGFSGTDLKLRSWQSGLYFGIGTDVTKCGANPPTPSDSSQCKFFRVAVEVCNPSMLESNCAKYVNSSDSSEIVWKPTGLIQANMDAMNFGAFGYLMDNSSSDANLKRDGGVLRALLQNVSPEFTPTGTFKADPYLLADSSLGIASSGTINYLNRFGFGAKSYKRFDQVSEMYAESIKYYQGGAATASYVSGLTNSLRDGFPVFGADGDKYKWNDPIKYSCQKNFVIGIGDVNTHADKNLSGNADKNRTDKEPSVIPSDSLELKVGKVADWTDKVGALEGISGLAAKQNYGGCCNNNGAYIAGIAYYAHTTDLRPDLPNTKSNPKQTVSTYWVDVLEYGAFKSKNQYWLAAKYGGFSKANDEDTNPLFESGDIWNKKGRKYPVGEDKYDLPDNYFPAADAKAMVEGLKSAFGSISDEAASGAGVGLSSSSLSAATDSTSVFQVTFKSKEWTGDVKGFTISSIDTSTNTITLSEKWSAAAKLNALAKGVNGWSKARKIAAFDKVVDAAGKTVYKPVPFHIESLSATTKAYLGADLAEQTAVVNYVRGDNTYEATGETYVFRARPTTILGDIVDSKAVYVGAPSALYSDVYNPGYSAFVSAKKDRTPVVYVGANDGMLHAFNAMTDGSAGSGDELFAVVPYDAFQGPNGVPSETGLKALTIPGAAHHYYVDATPEVRDVDFERAGDTDWKSKSKNDWRTLLVAGLGKGGRSFIALDVTDVGSVSESDETGLKNSAGNPVLLWEFTHPDMGYSFGRPLIVKTAKWGWVVILTGGYNNTNGSDTTKQGKGVLFVLNPKTGELLQTVYTSAGSYSDPSGLAQITGYTQNYQDYTTDQIYGGDLFGNVWRFEARNGSNGIENPLLFAVLEDSGSPAKTQPITTAPQIEYSVGDLKRYVFFGTGRMLHSDDVFKSPGNAQKQSFYAIRDGMKSEPYDSSGASFPITRSKLTQLTDLLAGITVIDSSTKGWYYDLTNSGGSSKIPERVVQNPQANDGVIAWVGTIMGDDPCAPVGAAAIYAVKYGSGRSVMTEKDVSTGEYKPVAFLKDSSGVVGLQQTRYGTSIRILGTKSNGTPAFYGGGINGTGDPRVVNWRIIGQ